MNRQELNDMKGSEVRTLMMLVGWDFKNEITPGKPKISTHPRLTLYQYHNSNSRPQSKKDTGLRAVLPGD